MPPRLRRPAVVTPLPSRREPRLLRPTAQPTASGTGAGSSVSSRQGEAARARESAPKQERQPALDLEPEQQPVLPSLELLAKPQAVKTEAIDEEALEKNARLLETVLEDFGVRGQIVQVRPGPVVTLYELEPAPGIKASRIIGLADDIARSMSAISVRVAVVSGPQRDRHRAAQPQGRNGVSARAARFAGLREAIPDASR